jgi:hypothetical protein
MATLIPVETRAGICSVVEQSLKIVKKCIINSLYHFSLYENIGLFYIPSNLDYCFCRQRASSVVAL